jgi:hypothetical protein
MITAMLLISTLDLCFLHGVSLSMDIEMSLAYFKSSLKGGYSFAQFGIDMINKINIVSSKKVSLAREEYARYKKIIEDCITAEKEKTISDLTATTTVENKKKIDQSGAVKNCTDEAFVAALEKGFLDLKTNWPY